MIIFEAGLTTGGLGCFVGGAMFAGGAILCADSTGWTTDLFNINKAFDTGLNIGLNFIPSGLLAKARGNVFKLAVKKGKFLDNMGRTGQIVKVTFNGLRVTQNAVYGEARNKIIAPPIRNTILPYLNGN